MRFIGTINFCFEAFDRENAKFVLDNAVIAVEETGIKTTCRALTKLKDRDETAE